MYDQQGRIYTRPESTFLWLEYPGPDGRKIRRSAKTKDEKEANAELIKQISLVNALSFKEAAVDFFTVKSRPGQLKPKTISNYQTSLRSVAPMLSHLTLCQINREVLKDLVRSRRETVSDTAVKRDLAFVSSVFSHAIETMPEAPEHNPVLSFPKRHLKENPRSRWLRPAEYKRLLKACRNDTHRLILETAVLTGMRHSELCRLRKGMFDFEKREILLPSEVTKNGRDRVIPVCESLCLKLQQLCLETPDDLVFCHPSTRTHEWLPYANFARFWGTARRRADLNDVRFHDLRHTFASWWVQAGGDLLTLRNILGHGSLQMVQRYAHLDTAGYREEVREVFGTQFRHSIE